MKAAQQSVMDITHRPFRYFQACISTYMNTFLVCTERPSTSSKTSSQQMHPVQNNLQDGAEQALLAACQSSEQTKPMTAPLLPRDSSTTSRLAEPSARQSNTDGATNRCRFPRDLFCCPITLVSEGIIRQSINFCCSPRSALVV